MIRVIISRSISCAERIAHVQGIRNAHKMLVRIPVWKRPLENHRYNWETNTK
jgi:hypothetical protein